MDVKTGLFYLFAAVLLFAAFRVITSRNPVYAALYLVLAFFDSYESAMENSNLPETAEFGQKQSAFLDAPMAFTDLDVVEDR